MHRDRHSPEAQQAWLKRIEDICAERGGQVTPLRRAILRSLVGADGPIGAYAIMEELARG